jgi:hypothetical protein
MEKFLENLFEAEKILKKLDHMIYVTYPVVKDKRLLLRILIETKIAIAKCINSILHYEYLYKRIKLTKDPIQNLRTFKVKCAPKYDISFTEIKLMVELFNIIEKHKKSPFEFRKEDKIVILSENSEPKIIIFEDTKEFLTLAKEILNKTKKNILSHF